MKLSNSQQDAIDRALLALTYYETLADDNTQLKTELITEYGRDYIMESMLALVSLLVLFNTEEKLGYGVPLETIYKGSVQDIRAKILKLVTQAES